MTPGLLVTVALVAVQVFAFDGPVRYGPAYGTYQWPVRGPVIRGYEPPADPYGPGHRGIDIAAPFGTSMAAAQDGVVAFAGWIGGALFISIDHADGVRTTYSWLSAVGVKKGAAVSRGSLIGATGQGHPGVTPPHLHFGARIGQTYIDPMLLLEGAGAADFIHLAPLAWPPGPAREWSPERGAWLESGEGASAMAKSSMRRTLEWPDLADSHARRLGRPRDRGPPFLGRVDRRARTDVSVVGARMALVPGRTGPFGGCRQWPGSRAEAPLAHRSSGGWPRVWCGPRARAARSDQREERHGARSLCWDGPVVG